MKYLIVGLGNKEDKYLTTRHNVGFQVLDSLAEKYRLKFSSKRYGSIASFTLKNHQLVLLQPNTYVNLSGKAVNYWLQKEKITTENLLIIVDDVALPFRTLRLRVKGGSAGHNGLQHIEQILGHQRYPRLRVGIGNDYFPGEQVRFVLGSWSEEEQTLLHKIFTLAVEIIENFVLQGAERTMNMYNKKRVCS